MHSYALQPKPAGQVAPKLPEGNTSPFSLRFYEAAFRDLAHPASSSRPRTAGGRPSRCMELRDREEGHERVSSVNPPVALRWSGWQSRKRPHHHGSQLADVDHQQRDGQAAIV
jgi:hypothetical protein